MKLVVSVFFVVIGLLACTKESDALKAGLQSSIPNAANPSVQQVLKRGLLYPTSGIQVMGVAKIIQQPSGLQVQLDSFSVSTGPDLKVYLARTAAPGNHLNLGNLQSNSGTQYYRIPTGTDLSLYPYVLIHCQQYNHLFSYASLQ